MTSSADIVTASVVFTIQLHISLGAALFILFEYLKFIQQDIYQPKYHRHQLRLPRLSKMPVYWIYQILNQISDYQVQSTVGADGYVFLRALRCLSLLFTCIAVLSVSVLIPVYSSASDSIVGINSITIANVVAGSRLLWVSCVANWIFVALFLLFFHYEYQCYKELKSNAALQNMDGFLTSSQACSIMVVNIPAPYQSSIRLHQLFDHYFPNLVRSANIALDLNDDVKEVIRKRSRYVRQLESSIAAYESRVASPPDKTTAKVGPLLQVPADDYGSNTPYKAKDVDDIMHYYNKALKYNQIYQQVLIQTHQIDLLHHQLYSVGPEHYQDALPLRVRMPSSPSSHQGYPTHRYVHLSDLSSTGFVTFTSRYTCIAACQWKRIDTCFPAMRIRIAPHPLDVLWANIKYSHSYTDYMRCCTNTLYYVGILGWGAVIGFITAISSLSYLETFIPALKNINRSMYIFLQGQLSVWALLIVMVLLPTCIRYLSKYVERQKTRSAVDLQVFRWYYSFQMTNVCYTVLAGTTYNLLREALHNPWHIVPLLAKALPTVSVLFINLLLTMLLSGVALELLRPIPSIVYTIQSRVLRQKTLTVRTVLEGPLAAEYIDYSWICAQLLYVLCIALTYWVIAPLVVVVASLWFWAQYVLYKYKLCYVLHKRYETGGTYWDHLYSRIMMLLLATTFLNIGYMAIKQGTAQVSALTPLPILIYASWSYTEYQFKDLSSETAYQQAKEQSNVGIGDGMFYDIDALSRRVMQYPNNRNDEEKESKNAPISVELMHMKTTGLSGKPYQNTDIAAHREYQSAHLRQPEDLQPYAYRHNDIPLFSMREFDGYSLNPVYYDPPLSSLEEIATKYLQ